MGENDAVGPQLTETMCDGRLQLATMVLQSTSTRNCLNAYDMVSE